MSALAWWILGIGVAGGGLLLVLNLVTSEKKIIEEIRTAFSVRDPQFTRLVCHLLGPTLEEGNRIGVLQNGDEIFPAMLAAVRRAQRSVCFETFIYWTGAVGREFAEAFAERARAGVAVHVILDGLGTGSLDDESLRLMTGAGVQIEKFHPVRWRFATKLNNRTHRKLLVVDGTIGFTGGVGIADQWQGRAQDPDHWRDVHFQVEGPVVAQLQATFIDNWLKTRAALLHGDDYFPPLARCGELRAQLFKSSPDEGSESARLLYLLSIAAARHDIAIANAYFVPDDLSRATLLSALARGVRVRIIVPGPFIDTTITRRASRARWGPLLQAGAEIHEYQPTMFHCKVMVVDGVWSTVGSTNFDSRSFRLNSEANLNVHDEAFANALMASFDDDLRRSRPVTWDQWRTRPLGEKLVEHAAVLFRSQL